MGDGALGSDHINYLIIRYLQEAGHENAAKALLQDWNRPEEYIDPEQLPFAPQVKQFELVNIIQDGLFHDQLQAQVTKQSPRFSLIQHVQQSPPPETTHRRTSSGDSTRQPKQSSRPRSSHKDHTEQDDFPLPAPKRVRKSNGDESSHMSVPTSAQTNGDLMDVDSKTPLTTGGDDDDDTHTDRAMSDVVDRSSPVSRIAIETSSAGTQTEKKSRSNKSETIYWSVEKEDASIGHAIWNPRPKKSKTMLVIGDSVCRFYQVPPGSEEAGDISTNLSVDRDTPQPSVNGHAKHQTHHVDVEDIPKGSVATAACWHPTGNYATCCLALNRQINGTQHTTRWLFDTNTQGPGVKRAYNDNAYINVLRLSGEPVTLALRWNREGSLLMGVSTNVVRGLLEVWRDPSEEPIAVKMFPRPIVDAVWMSNDTFVVCGDRCLESYRVTFTHQQGRKDDGSMMNGHAALSPAQNTTLFKSYPTDRVWEKVRYDAANRVVAALSDTREIILLGQSSSSDNDSEWIPLPGFPPSGASTTQISALAFEHERIEDLDADADADAESEALPRRLATTHHTGAVHVYGITSTECALQHVLCYGESSSAPEAALALSWSPDGSMLAVASEEGVRVWRLPSSQSGLPAEKAHDLLQWKANPDHWKQPLGAGDADADGDEAMNENGDVEDDVQIVHQPALAWDTENASFVFASGRRMAVVRLLS